MGITTLSTLLLELSLTRVFSVVFYYHFAFLAISIALFGLGAGGVLSYVVAGWRGNIFLKLGTLAILDSFAVLLSLILVLAQRDPDKPVGPTPLVLEGEAKQAELLGEGAAAAPRVVEILRELGVTR